MRPDFVSGKETILIISPQPWHGFHVSKHHYAVELERHGNHVYFLDPPDGKLKAGEVLVESTSAESKIFLVRYQYWFPSNLKFRSRVLFDWCMRRQARLILRHLPEPLTMVWDFDNTYSFNDLRVFGAKFRVFHPVDLIVRGRTGAKQAHAAYSVAPKILDDLQENLPTQFVPHGIGREHEAFAIQRRQHIESTDPFVVNRGISVGYVGNMVRPSIDRELLFTIVSNHPDIQFHFFGPTDSAGDPSAEQFIMSLRGSPNCVLHGLSSQAYILEQALSIDAWLVCYDYRIDSNVSLNTHKMLEYFATGSVVVSSFIESYDGSKLLVMAPRGSNEILPHLFASTMRNLSMHNNLHSRLSRIEYALQHRYGSHLAIIQQHLQAVLSGA